MREGSLDPKSKLWPGKWAENRRAAQMVRRDLESAGIPYRNSQGRVFDFHAFRHTFITNLSRAGVFPKVAQELARHSSITLTLARYTHMGLFDLKAGIAALLELTNGSSESATGTSVCVGSPAGS